MLTVAHNSSMRRAQVEKTGKPLKEGEVVEKVDYCAVDSEVEATTGGAATAEESAAEQPEVPGIKKLYFVRVPRPPMDDSHGVLKKLQDDFQGHVAKIKKINAKLSVRRVRAWVAVGWTAH